MTSKVAATEFCRNFGVYQRQVQREPIEISSHGRVTGYFLSPEDFERVQRILAASRHAYHPSDLPEHIKAAVRDARMDPEHDALNSLMEAG